MKGVGKSCLSIKGTKDSSYANIATNTTTVGFEYVTLTLKFNNMANNTIVKLQVWDTSGQEIYKSLVTNFYRSSSLAVVVYSIVDRKSFEDVEQWINEIKVNASERIKIFLIGNKSDLENR